MNFPYVTWQISRKTNCVPLQSLCSLPLCSGCLVLPSLFSFMLPLRKSFLHILECLVLIGKCTLRRKLSCTWSDAFSMHRQHAYAYTIRRQLDTLETLVDWDPPSFLRQEKVSQGAERCEILPGYRYRYQTDIYLFFSF